LKKLDYLNRDQLAKIHRLGKVRNTNRILKELSPYLSSFREEYSTIYYLNKEGRAYVNSQKIRKKNSLVNHVIMRNDFYIYSGYPHDWQNEIRVKDDDYTIICDAYFKRHGRYHFLEVDSFQKMSENKKKVERYAGLMKNGAVEKQLGYFPQLLWLTTTELRRKQLTELCKTIPNTAVFTIDDIR
jgi:hypothetical protein